MSITFKAIITSILLKMEDPLLLEMEKTIGELVKELYDLWDIQYTNWPNQNNPTHLEFTLNNFDPNSKDQIKLVATLCYVIKSGTWETSYKALQRLLPEQEFEDITLNEIKNYFSGEEYKDNQKDFQEYIKNQRNPFILELISHVLLNSVQHQEACNPFCLSLKGVHYMHLSSKKQGLDLAAIAQDSVKKDYYLIIGESKNRKSPSDGTSEALDSFKKYDEGKHWPDIRQVMKTVANGFENQESRLSADISKHIFWQKKIIYRLTIEHRSKKPLKGSQFRNFGDYTPNVKFSQFRQCEALYTARLDDFYNEVSDNIIKYIEKELKTYVR